MVIRSSPIRCSKELRKIINIIRARYILAGKKPPSTVKITRLIAKKINGQDLIEDEFIRF